MTYSIVARDPGTGDLGVAVQTAFFAVGSIVPWARPGIGVVATQAFADSGYGPRCLDALVAGLTPTAALDAARAADLNATIRQVGLVAADGNAAAFTGTACIDHAGHLLGDGFAVQANMMSSPTVWPAMAEAYIGTDGALARRLLAALVAAEDAGGDARGVMSAALVVVTGEPAEPGAGVVVDLRVDRSADPLGELAGLLDAADAYTCYSRASDELAAGNAEAALTECRRGLTLLPGEENLRFLQAGALLAAGHIDEGRGELSELIAQRPSWGTIARSFVAKGLVPVPPGVPIDALFG
jgi:uncharacterized Ntn-hydrolase superfamily protein